MIRKISVGIDVGTYSTRVVVCEYLKNESVPKVIGTGISPSRGLRHGYVTNHTEASKGIKKAVNEAEKNSGIKIKRAVVSIGGISLSSETSTGDAVISKANDEVTTLDIIKAINLSEENLKIPNKKIIHNIPIEYKLDGKEILGKPEGMKGLKLEVKTLFVTCLEQHLENLILAVREAGVEVGDIIASPLASSAVVLSERQKTAGCALIDIGAETVSLAVFENNNLISLYVFNVGSTQITNDIALGFKIPLEEAESLKIGSIIGDFPRKKLTEIIDARLSDIFELVEIHLKKLKRNGLLPAGIIITGGGSHISTIEELSKSMLKLPSRIGGVEDGYSKNKLKDTSWFVAYGLCVAEGGDISDKEISGGGANEVIRKTKKFFNSIFQQLMP
ncbi:MAG: cell division protein FtsA [Candidatus Paceibacterota bacterium]|jgi:cell division protein FtsA